MIGNEGDPAVFLDRDGVINVDRSDYVKHWGEFEWIEETPPALRELQEAGFDLVVVTNQSCVGRGIVTRDRVDAINQRMLEGLVDRGVTVEGLYVCPHAPDAGCACRKPKPGLIETAVEDIGVDREASYIIGDSKRDVTAGRRAGLRDGFLVEQDRGPGAAVDEILSRMETKR